MRKNEQRGVGRPRSTEVDQVILAVTLQQMAKEGYERMSVEQIAFTANVGKPTIYRRWASKADLATAALGQLRMSEPPVSTGTARGDLVASLQNYQRNLMRPNGMNMLGTLLVEEHHQPELLKLFRKQVIQPRRKQIATVLQQGVESGELPADTDVDAVTTMIIGSFYARYLATGVIPKDWPVRVAATLQWV